MCQDARRHGVTALPVADVEDVRARFEALFDIELNSSAAQAGERAHAIVCEATEVFGAARTRMQTLNADTRSAPVQARELVF